MIQTVAAIAACLILIAVAALHIYWALGGYWPGEDEASLVAKCIGSGTKMPPVWMTLMVALALLIGAWLVLAGRGILRPPFPGWCYTAALWVLFGVFALRGSAGMLIGQTRDRKNTPFHRLNLLYYSPLCLVIAALIAVSAI
jgi:hypothetical protein